MRVLAALAVLASLVLFLLWVQDVPAPESPGATAHASASVPGRTPEDGAEDVDALASHPSGTRLVAESPRASLESGSDEAARITVTVVDAEGQPLSGATVTAPTVTTPSERPGEGWQTDTNGQARIPAGLRSTQGYLTLQADAPGYAHQRWVFPPGDALRLRLRRATSLTIQVLDDETSLSLVHVAEVVDLHSNCMYCGIEDARRPLQADLSGRARLDELPSGVPLEFKVRADGYAGRTVGPWTLTPTPDGEEVIVRLRKGVLVRGQAVWWTSGKPVPGALLLYGGSDPATTNEEGRFELRIDDLAHAESPDSISVFPDREQTHAILFIELRPGELDRPLRIVIPEPVQVRGRVLDADGRAIPGADVGLSVDQNARAKAAAEGQRPPEATQRMPIGTTSHWRGGRLHSTDAEGRYEFRAAAAFESFLVLRAHHEGFVSGSHEFQSAPRPGATFEVDLVLQAGRSGTISGQVLRNGKQALGYVEASQGDWNSGALTMRGGWYTIGQVPVGPVALALSLKDDQGFSAGGVVERRTVEVRAGEETAADWDVPIALGTIAGRVLWSDGTPVEGQRVGAACRCDGRHGRLQATTDEAGRFELEAQAACSGLTLVTSRNARTLQREDVLPDTRGLELVLPLPATLRLRVRRDGRRTPLRAIEAYLRPIDGAWASLAGTTQGSPDAEGWRELQVPGEILDLWVADRRGPGRPALRESLAFRPGQALELDLVLERGVELLVHLEDPHGDPPWTALLPEQAADGRRFDPSDVPPELIDRLTLQEPTDSTYRLRGLTPGRHRFQDRGGTLQFEPATIDVTDAPGQEVTVRVVR